MSKKKLNQAQEEAIQYTDGPLLIVAGAGTGKTTVITEKIAKYTMLFMTAVYVLELIIETKASFWICISEAELTEEPSAAIPL